MVDLKDLGEDLFVHDDAHYVLSNSQTTGRPPERVAWPCRVIDAGASGDGMLVRLRQYSTDRPSGFPSSIDSSVVAVLGIGLPSSCR